MNSISFHGEGSDINESHDESESDVEHFTCGCGLAVHLADLQLHCISCVNFQPSVCLNRISDPQIFITCGLSPPRSLSLRRRKKISKSSLLDSLYLIGCPLSDCYIEEMSEGGMEYEASGGESREESLSTPPPAVMSFQIDETKPNISQINNSNQGSEEDENSQPPNGVLSPHDDASKSVENEGDKTMDSMLDELLDSSASALSAEPFPSDPVASESPAPQETPPTPLPTVQSDQQNSKEDGDKEKDGSGSELNSLINEMLEDKKPSQEPPASPVNTPQPPVPPVSGGLRMRPMLDLMGSSGPKEEKVEEPFAALNVLVNNLQGPSQPQSMIKSEPLSFQPISSISSLPAPPLMAGPSPSPQVSIQKRPPPQNFPPGITMTRQPRRDSEGSSSSSSHSPTPASPKLPEGITLVKPGQKSADPVASMLATRGVSVMPSGRSEPVQALSITKTTPKPAILPGSNSALTITATPPKRPRISPVPLTTVDLTDDSVLAVRRAPPPPVTTLRPRAPNLVRGRPPAATCDVCDKVFANSDALRIHMQTHAPGRRGVGAPIGPPRAPLRPPAPVGPYPLKPGVFECEVCTARYQTQQQLLQHTQRFHPDRFGGSVGHQFALPVVDLNDSRTPSMLASLGIRYCIPMADLQQNNGAPGHYALPLIAMDGAINPAVCNLDHMNCSNLLPLGTMKAVRRQ